MTGRVAVIGAGPCGLGQLRAFQQAKSKGADIPEIVCFEKQSDWGGLWNYTWRTGIDEYGEPVHCSMYRYLWSNGPKECLEFADYTFDDHFKQPIPSYPPREVLYDYITGRAKDGDLKSWIQFNTAVRHVAYDKNSGKFSVTVERLTGPYAASPNVRLGRRGNRPFLRAERAVLPRHRDVSRPRPACARLPQRRRIQGQGPAGRRRQLLGRGHRAAMPQIRREIRHHVLAHGSRWASNGRREWTNGRCSPRSTARPFISRMDRAKDFDAIILCTGYQHHFPFLETALKLRTHNRMHPPHIYKGIFWIDNPKLMYLGMQDQFYTFSMFDAQAWYARDVILGRIKLPSKAEMQKDDEKWVKREEALKDAFAKIDFQADYVRDLCAATDYPKFDIDMTVDEFKEWEHDKEDSIVGYRNKAFKSPCTGTMAPVHHTPWLEAMDDTMKTFLSVKRAAAE